MLFDELNGDWLKFDFFWWVIFVKCDRVGINDFIN